MKKLIIITFSLIIIIVALWLIQKSFNLSLKPVVSNIVLKRKSVFDKYNVKLTKIGDNYGVLIKNLTASSADHTNRYINVDLYIETVDKNSSKLLVRNQKQTVFTITDVMTNFKISDLTTPNGKKFFKKQIKKALELKFGKNQIKNIYIYNMVFS